MAKNLLDGERNGRGHFLGGRGPGSVSTSRQDVQEIYATKH